jgi:hypothetical protein
MARDEDIASAIAHFQRSDDRALLQDVLRALRPKAAAAARRYEERGREPPPPKELATAAVAATKAEALRAARGELDFGQLQAIARAVGRRLEHLAQEGP